MAERRIFDESLDKTIWEKGKDFGNNKKIIVGIYNYDDKGNKIGFKRLEPVKREDRTESYRKLGRVTRDEALFLVEAMNEAMPKLG